MRRPRKAPAALCRKVAEAPDGGTIEIWGDGRQTRSFLYIDECLEGTTRLLRSDVTGPVNIGSDEMISINDLARMVAGCSGKTIAIRNIPGPTGVRGRNSDNRLIRTERGCSVHACGCCGGKFGHVSGRRASGRFQNRGDLH